MQNIVKLFPDIFEIESVDRKWYETLGMWLVWNMQ